MRPFLDVRHGRGAAASALILAVAAMAVPVASVTAARPAASPAAGACKVTNTTTKAKATTLQAAVDAAVAKQTLVVQGTCTGTTTIGKSLKIVGVPSKTLGKPTLVAPDASRVLEITAGVVTITGLRVTGGDVSAAGSYPAYSGGGILNVGKLTLRDVVVAGNKGWLGGGILTTGPLILTGTTRITGNTARQGAGLDVEPGMELTPPIDTIPAGTQTPLTLRDTARVDHNTATDGDGGGISSYYGKIRMLGAAQVDHNTSSRSGGGIEANLTDVSMNGSSSIHHNTSDYAGGLESYSDYGYENVMVMNDTSSVYANVATNPDGVMGLSIAGDLTMNDHSVVRSHVSATVNRAVEIYHWKVGTTPTLTMTGASRIRNNALATATNKAALTTWNACYQPVTLVGTASRVVNNAPANIADSAGC